MEALRATIGGIVRFSVAFTSSRSPQIKGLVQIIRTTGLSVGKLAFNFSNHGIFSTHGMGMPDLEHICHCGAITAIARLARHQCQSVRRAVAKVLHLASREWGICSEVFLSTPVLSTVPRPRWEDRLVRVLSLLGVGLLASFIAPCPDAWTPQVQLAGTSWTHQTGMMCGSAICILSGPAEAQDVGHLPDTSHSIHPDLALATDGCFTKVWPPAL